MYTTVLFIVYGKDLLSSYIPNTFRKFTSDDRTRFLSTYTYLIHRGDPCTASRPGGAIHQTWTLHSRVKKKGHTIVRGARWAYLQVATQTHTLAIWAIKIIILANSHSLQGCLDKMIASFRLKGGCALAVYPFLPSWKICYNALGFWSRRSWFY